MSIYYNNLEINTSPRQLQNTIMLRDRALTYSIYLGPHMPAKPAWFHKVNEILESLETIEAPLLDRRAIQTLFGVQRRRAQQMMQTWSGFRLGTSFLIDRQGLIENLHELAKHDDVLHEIRRKTRIEEELARTSAILKGRRVRFHVSNDAPSPTIEGLPHTITMDSGELRIQFFGTEDLLRQLFELSQAIANDYAGFQERTECARRGNAAQCE